MVVFVVVIVLHHNKRDPVRRGWRGRVTCNLPSREFGDLWKGDVHNQKKTNF
jgi:hypothetical protein